MTTIICYGGKIAADKRVFHSPMVGAKFCRDGGTKIFKTECGRAAFCFFADLPAKKYIPIIMDGFMVAIEAMLINKTYPSIQLSRETIMAIPKETGIIIAIKDRNLYFGAMEEFITDNKVLDSKPGTIFDLVLVDLEPTDFSATGTGENYAVGIHCADPEMPIEEIMRRACQLDRKSSLEFDVVDSKKLKQFLSPIKKTRVNKNVNCRSR